MTPQPPRDAGGPVAMNLTSPSQVREFLAQQDLHPSKALGQNFLIDRNILNILIDAAALEPDDAVLEVGAGLGVVTEQLVAKVRRVVAVEKDKRLCASLRERFGSVQNLEIRCADMLDVDLAELQESGIRVIVSNLPYSVGTRILLDQVRSPRPPDRMVVTVQLEVAERMVASPGTRARGLLSVWTQFAYDVTLVKTVGPRCFLPCPEVKSAIVKLVRNNRFSLLPERQSFFYDLTKYAFSQRRKQLATVLGRAPEPFRLESDAGHALLEQLGVDVKTRPENLDVAQWCALVEHWPEGQYGKD